MIGPRPISRRPLVATAILVLLAGCASQHPRDAAASRPVPAALPTTPAAAWASDPETSLNPCADRLHEISGLLLEYVFAHQELPRSLTQLAGTPLVCPASGKPYLYNPVGIPYQVDGFAGRIILMDATPAHDGQRWGIAIAEPKPGQPLTTHIVVVPQSDPGDALR